jgi:hypothetical protein
MRKSKKRDWVKKLQRKSNAGDHSERVTVSYFPERRFVAITVPSREVKTFVENLVNVKRVVFQPNHFSRVQHGKIEVVFDDGSKNPFMVTMEPEDFGYPTFPFVTARNDLRVSLCERGVPEALTPLLPGESTLELRERSGGYELSGRIVI